jgi:hypothetical protein
MAQNITYISRFNQRKDYSGLTFGNITPTDIDSFLDFGNKVFVIIEFKLEGMEMPFGQQLAIERLVDVLAQSKPTIGIVATHSTKPEDEIVAGNCPVEKYRYKANWKTRSTPTTTRELIDIFLSFYKYEYK